MSEQAAAPVGAEGSVGDSSGADDSGADPMSDASLEAAAVALAETFGVEDAAAEGVADAAAKPAATGATPEPTAAADPAADAAAAEAARIEALVAKQLETRQHQTRMEQRLAAIEAENAALKSKVSDYQVKLKDNPLEVLEAEGWDPEALAGAMVGQKNPLEVKLKQAMRAIEALKAEREAETRSAREAREAAEAQATAVKQANDYRDAKVTPALKAGESKYIHFITDVGGVEQAAQIVYQELDRRWRAENREYPADAVAALFEAQAKKRFEAIRDKVMTSPAAVAGAKPKPKTLTNNLTQTGTTTDDDDLSDEALTKKAIEYARLSAG